MQDFDFWVFLLCGTGPELEHIWSVLFLSCIDENESHQSQTSSSPVPAANDCISFNAAFTMPRFLPVTEQS